MSNWTEKGALELVQIFMIGIAVCFGMWCLSIMFIKTFGWDDDYALAIAQCNDAVPSFRAPDVATGVKMTMDENAIKMIQACHEQVTKVYDDPSVPTIGVK